MHFEAIAAIVDVYRWLSELTFEVGKTRDLFTPDARDDAAHSRPPGTMTDRLR